MENYKININRDEIAQILSSFVTATEIPICFIEKTHLNNVNEFTDCAFCNSIRLNDNIFQACNKCDKQAFDVTTNTGAAYLYECHIGLWEAVYPLFVHKNLIGYLMLGHIADDKANLWTSIEYTLNEAGLTINEVEQAKLAFDHKERYSKAKIKSFVEMMQVIGSYIINSNLISIYNSSIIEKTLYYINNNFTSDLSTYKLAERAEISQSSLANKFKRATGVSISEYIESLRMNHAKQFLELTSYSIKEISFKCGYSDYNYFCRVFKKNNNISPAQYRDNYIQDNRPVNLNA